MRIQKFGLLNVLWVTLYCLSIHTISYAENLSPVDCPAQNTHFSDGTEIEPDRSAPGNINVKNNCKALKHQIIKTEPQANSNTSQDKRKNANQQKLDLEKNDNQEES